MLGALSNQAGDGIREPLITIASTVGGLWLDALKMTVIPLIIALLITGVVSGADQARAGRIAARSVLWFVIVLTSSAAFGTLAMPALLEAFPLPGSCRRGAAGGPGERRQLRPPRHRSRPCRIGFASLIPTNPIAAAAE